MLIQLFRFAAILGFVAFTAGANALPYGTYVLDNHPNGNQNPPAYGLRLDGLLDGSSVYTFDVTNRGLGNGVTLVYSATGIHISGSVWGGRDTGTGTTWSDPELWTVSFDYTMVTGVPGDDDVWTLNGNKSFSSTIFGSGFFTRVGTLDTWDLRDQSNGSYSFQFGDENGLGHRGFDGISGWGWLDFRPTGDSDWQHVGSDDWLFTAKAVPEGGWRGDNAVIAALGLMGFAAACRRRPSRAT